MITTNTNIHSTELEGYLQESKGSRKSQRNHDNIQGGLRLLVHKWQSKSRSESTHAPLPFKDPPTLAMVLTKLKLPKSYPLDYARRQHVPARVTVNEQTFGKFGPLA